jgi:hypothetical protein
MPSKRALALREAYRFQTQLIHSHVEGITEDESLLQLPFEANCLNWVIGHIVSRRHSALEALGVGSFWTEDALSRYRTGSQPITSAENAIPLPEQLTDLDRSLKDLETALENATEETLDTIVINDRGEKSAMEHLEGFLWHENYHIGQLDLLQAFIKSKRTET